MPKEDWRHGRTTAFQDVASSTLWCHPLMICSSPVRGPIRSNFDTVRQFQIQHVWVPFLLSKSAKIMNTNQCCKYLIFFVSSLLTLYRHPNICLRWYFWTKPTRTCLKQTPNLGTYLFRCLGWSQTIYHYLGGNTPPISTEMLPSNLPVQFRDIDL